MTGRRQEIKELEFPFIHRPDSSFNKNPAVHLFIYIYFIKGNESNLLSLLL